MSQTKPKPIGERGSWFATYKGRRLPCVHDKNMKSAAYDAPTDGDARSLELLNAIIECGQVILRKSERDSEDKPWTGVDYIALFDVADARIEDSRFRFRFVKRHEF